MYIEKSEILNTKMIAPRINTREIEKALFGCGYGYELALDKDLRHKKAKLPTTLVAFFIDYNGYIHREDNDGHNDTGFFEYYDQQSEQEINWEVLL